MKATVLTLFPEMFPGPLGLSLSGRALAAGKWSLEAVNIRDFAQDKHKTVDDTPFGGGPGMVLRPDVLARAVDHALTEGTPRLIYLTPKGEPFTQAKAEVLAREKALVFLCGHYEGVDQRILEAYPFEEISLGDFVLSGGEMAALTMLDAVVRLLPEVIGDAESLSEESFEHGLLEYPHYTRPQEFRGITVPDVLLSGHHAEIASWRRRQAELLTQKKRPDLWNSYCNLKK